MNIDELKIKLSNLINSDPDIIAACFVGSYARNERAKDSDVDVVILCSDPNKFISDNSWIHYFGTFKSKNYEVWGKVKTIRVWFQENLEIEFNFASKDWAIIPVDKGTYKVINNGMNILYDPQKILEALKDEISMK